MDLGCIDMGCVEKPNKTTSTEKENGSPQETSATKLGKINKAKDALRSSFSALNKLTSQISKPPHRKTSSPLNWFPRKKVEPYLKRKIKMLQEVDGMHLTLDETLGDSNPHYSRVLKEKIAIREAAEKAMEARKAAMVEASWCRILQAASIESKEAEDQLSKAEIAAAEAFEDARAVGVIMNDIPDCATNQYRIEASAKGESTTHTVSATFETAFEVDRQVAAAVKAAFIKLGSCPPINKDDFKELLCRISENPDNNMLDITSERESDAVPELETRPCKNSLHYQEETGDEILGKHKKRRESDKFSMAKMVDMMLGRLRCLKEGELASLATIVATSGLNAALAEIENGKPQSSSSATENTENPGGLKDASRVSLGRRTSRNSFARDQVSGAGNAELPSLDKFLVKRLTRLEREVLEAKNSRKNESSDDKLAASIESSRSEAKLEDSATIPDLGSMLVKRPSKLEKEVEEARMKGESLKLDNRRLQRTRRAKQDVEEIVPSLDKVLVKRLTRLEREVQEARNRQKMDPSEGRKAVDSMHATTLITDAARHSEEEIVLNSSEDSQGKENTDLNRIENRSNDGANFPRNDYDNASKETKKKKEESCKRRIGAQNYQSEEYESLDKVLVKHVSRLEKEKQEFDAEKQMRRNPKRKETTNGGIEQSECSLDQVLVKRKSRLEKEKEAGATQQEEDGAIMHSVSRRQARERELQAAWGGLSLGNSMRPHVSRLQQEKAAWIKAEEEERKRAVEEHQV